MKNKERRVIKLKAKNWNAWDIVKTAFIASPFWYSVNILLQVVEALIPTLFMFATADFVDTAIAVLNGEMEYNSIFIPLYNMMLTSGVNLTIYSVEWFIDIKMQNTMKLYVDEMFIEKKASIKYQYIESAKTNDLMKRVCETPGETMQNRANRLSRILYDVVQIAALIVVLFEEIWWCGIVAIVLAIPSVWIAIKNGLMQYKTFKDTKKIERYAAQYDSILKSKDFLEERTTFGYTEYVIDRWLSKRQEADKANLVTIRKNGGRENAVSALSWVIVGGIMLSLVSPVADGITTPGKFVALINYVTQMMWIVRSGIGRKVNWFTQMFENMKDLSAFTQLEDQPGALDEPEDMSSVGIQSIEFRNVSFAYPETERYILKDCSFTLNGNEHYAFVGVNGAGKTTITKLLMCLYDNYEGEIFINGKNLRDYRYSQIKGFFAVVHQDFAKYEIELKENVKLGDVTKDDDERMNTAIKEIQLDSAVEKLHSGVDTPLGKTFENGVELSGGEWQRVAIARNLYSDAPMKILDEPTAALDPVAESGIYQLFKEITKDKSAIFITHRLGAAKIADKILVIDGGKVAEFGSHNELMAQNGIYSEMFNTQKGWYES